MIIEVDAVGGRRKRKGTGGHHSASAATDEWLTPPEIIKALGPFDLDPCSPVERPWPTAARHYTILDNGLAQEWSGCRVFMNPPYGQSTGKWLRRLSNHGDGIALIFARTETADWFNNIWSRADAILFIRGRISFHFIDGTKAGKNSGAPSALAAYGERNVIALRDSGIRGAFICRATERERWKLI